MSEEAVRIGVENCFSHAGQVAQQEFSAIGYEYTRPSAVYRPVLTQDGDGWVALYGPNIAEGVCGTGNTPSAAMDAFDAAWRLPTGSAHREVRP